MTADDQKRPTTEPGSEPTIETTPPSGTPALSDLAATDALLDRLGAGVLGDDDLDDPAVTVLAELLSVVDDPGEVDGEVGRLMEVLDGRPLYLVGPDEAADEEAGAEDAPIRLGPAEPRVIDLTGPKPDEGEPAAEGDVAASAVVLPQNAKAQQRWGRRLSVMQQAGLPAASVLILLVLGGGVSAVVSGDPMAPVNGVTRIVSQLPGVDGDRATQASVGQVERELAAATVASRRNDKAGAAAHLQAARQLTAALPGGDQQARLAALATAVQTELETGVPATGVPGVEPADPGTGGVITTTTPPVVVVPPTTPADPPPVTDSPTSPPVTEAPTTTDPAPPTTPPTTEPAPSDSVSTEASVESTPSST